MKKKILYLASMMLAFSGLVGLMPISSVAATNNKDNDNKVCEGLDSGKIDTSGDPATVTVFAPEGKLISQYCVKAGSATQEDGGPEYVVVNPPVKTITFGHSSGKDVSHYSLSFVDEGEKVANIISSVVCTDEGAKVTLDNTGNIDGKVTLNGEAITVGAGETVERTFNTGDDGLQIVLVIDGKAVYDQLWDCKAGEVLGDSTTTDPEAVIPAVLPATGDLSTGAMVTLLSSFGAFVGLISFAARTLLARQI